MSVSTHPKVSTSRQPEPGNFVFTDEEWAEAEKHLAKYPAHHKASAAVPLLWICQRKLGGYLTHSAIEYVAQVLELAPVRVHEVAHFYSMFNHEHPGQYFIQVCRTTPCMVRGGDSLTEKLTEKLGVELGEVTEDGMFSVREVECLGACCNAPMVQINDWYCEDLTPERLEKVVDDLRAGRPVQRGSQAGRTTSEPATGPTTLTEVDAAGHAAYPFRDGAEAEPEEVRIAREEAGSGDGTGGES